MSNFDDPRTSYYRIFHSPSSHEKLTAYNSTFCSALFRFFRIHGITLHSCANQLVSTCPLETLLPRIFHSFFRIVFTDYSKRPRLTIPNRKIFQKHRACSVIITTIFERIYAFTWLRTIFKCKNERRIGDALYVVRATFL